MSFLWISYISSAVAVSFTSNFPIIRVSLLIFSRFVFCFYIITFKPYKYLLSNFRLVLNEIALIVLIFLVATNLFYKENHS